LESIEENLKEEEDEEEKKTPDHIKLFKIIEEVP
jgi:hypothetical protein